MENRKRPRGFHLRLTEKERALIYEASEADGMPPGALVRRAALRESARLIRNAGRRGGG